MFINAHNAREFVTLCYKSTTTRNLIARLSTNLQQQSIRIVSILLLYPSIICTHRYNNNGKPTTSLGVYIKCQCTSRLLPPSDTVASANIRRNISGKRGGKRGGALKMAYPGSTPKSKTGCGGLIVVCVCVLAWVLYERRNTWEGKYNIYVYVICIFGYKRA